MITFPQAARVLALGVVATASPAAAAPAVDRADHQVELTTVLQDLGPGRGTLSTTELELRVRTAMGAWSIAPVFGLRSQPGPNASAVAGTLGWRRDWSERFSTTSELFLAEARGPFAQAGLTQALAAKVARRTQLTAALRWSRYQGGQDVWFVSGEGRRYFRGGSAAYRLTWIKPADRGGYTGHLVSLTLNDPKGGGRTQLWLSQGQASLGPSQAPDTFRGQDRTVQLRRVQPLSRGLALSLSGGLAYYDLPAGAVHSRNIGLGLSLEF